MKKLGKKMQKQEGTFVAYACYSNCQCYCGACKNCTYKTPEATGRSVTVQINNNKATNQFLPLTYM